MNKQQTAVEWLEKQLLKNGYVNKGYHSQDSLNHLENLFLQAKEMEKEQIIDSYSDGRSDQQSDIPSKFYNRMAEQYYNETFNKL